MTLFALTLWVPQSLHITKDITVMNTHGRGCAGLGMGAESGDINPLGVVGFTPGLSFTVH